MEALQLEFAGMLKDTLAKMYARLEQQHVDSMTATHHSGKGGEEFHKQQQQQQPGHGMLAPVFGTLSVDAAGH